jgi:hypothetical protein
MILETIVAFDTTVAFVTPLVALLTASLVMWCKEHPKNFNVLHRAHLSNLVIIKTVLWRMGCGM